MADDVPLAVRVFSGDEAVAVQQVSVLGKYLVAPCGVHVVELAAGGVLYVVREIPRRAVLAARYGERARRLSRRGGGVNGAAGADYLQSGGGYARVGHVDVGGFAVRKERGRELRLIKRDRYAV